MARINTNISSLTAQRNLAQTNNDLAVRLQRLSTGLRINRGVDDPAGLIVSERLRSELKGLNQAVDNSQRASSVIATTEGYLAEINDLLNSVKSLVVQAANTGALSQEEIEANQLQIDSAIDSITRISNTASFAGLQLLNGSMEYLVSGMPTSAIQDVNVFSAEFGNNATVPVQVEVLGSAQTATLYVSGNMAGAAGELLSSVTLEIAGNRGVQTLNFISGTNLSAVVAAVNTIKDATGVSASLVSATDQTSGLVLNSVGYGSDQFVSVRKIGQAGAFWATYEAKGVGTEKQRDAGADVTAIVNGSLAKGRGTTVSLNTSSLGIELELTTAFAQTLASVQTFDITGGGINFQLGPEIQAGQRVGFGIQSVAASRVGGTSINGSRVYLDSIRSSGDYSIVNGNADEAAKILESAIEDVSVLRGRLGAFERNTIDTNVRSLQIGVENIASSESKIRDTDFASETAALTRAQTLAQAGTSVLAASNTSTQNVLALLQ